MASARILAFSAVATATSIFLTACSGGTVNVGATQEQELKKKTDGGTTGNGQTCGFDDTPAYSLGQTFKSPDGCNDCTCTEDGIMCTMRACAPAGGGQACSEEAKQCPDGSYVARTGPNCEFAPCPSEVACPSDAMQCPDGTVVGRTGPKCEFVCPSPTACTTEAKLCPDGKTYVSRTGPNCEFSPCP